MDFWLSPYGSLPLEIHHVILDYLDMNRLANLSIASRDLNAIVKSYFSTLPRLPPFTFVSEKRLPYVLTYIARLEELDLSFIFKDKETNLIRATEGLPRLKRLVPPRNYVISETAIAHPVLPGILTGVNLDNIPQELQAQFFSKLSRLTKIRLVGLASVPIEPSLNLEEIELEQLWQEGFPFVGDEGRQLFDARSLPALKSLHVVDCDTFALTPCIVTLEDHPGLRSLVFSRCDVTDDVLDLKLSFLSSLSIENCFCNRGVLVSALRRLMPQLSNLHVCLPSSLVHGLEGRWGQLSDLSLTIEHPYLAEEEIAASPVTPTDGATISFQFLAQMPRLQFFYVDIATDNGVQDDVSGVAQFPSLPEPPDFRGVYSWPRNLSSLHLNLSVDLPSLGPFLSSCLALARFSLKGSGEGPLTLNGQNLEDIEVEMSISLTLDDLPKLKSLRAPITTQLLQVLPVVTKFGITFPYFAQPTLEELCHCISRLVAKAPLLKEIGTSYFVPLLFDWFVAQPWFVICAVYLAGPQKKLFSQISRLLPLSEVPEILLHPPPSILPKPTFEDHEYHPLRTNIPGLTREGSSVSPEKILQDHPNVKAVVHYSFQFNDPVAAPAENEEPALNGEPAGDQEPAGAGEGEVGDL